MTWKEGFEFGLSDAGRVLVGGRRGVGCEK
jgi:hypothetical protein